MSWRGLWRHCFRWYSRCRNRVLIILANSPRKHLLQSCSPINSFIKCRSHNLFIFISNFYWLSFFWCRVIESNRCLDDNNVITNRLDDQMLWSSSSLVLPPGFVSTVSISMSWKRATADSGFVDLNLRMRGVELFRDAACFPFGF